MFRRKDDRKILPHNQDAPNLRATRLWSPIRRPLSRAAQIFIRYTCLALFVDTVLGFIILGLNLPNAIPVILFWVSAVAAVMTLLKKADIEYRLSGEAPLSDSEKAEQKAFCDALALFFGVLSLVSFIKGQQSAHDTSERLLRLECAVNPDLARGHGYCRASVSDATPHAGSVSSPQLRNTTQSEAMHRQ